MSAERNDGYQEHLNQINEEKAAVESIKEMIEEYSDSILKTWRMGDGIGGWIHEAMCEELSLRGKWNFSESGKKTYSKRKISATKRKQVFERDMYRCKHCDTHLNLTIDHIEPESKGGNDELDNLQTLCNVCNSKKGVK